MYKDVRKFAVGTNIIRKFAKIAEMAINGQKGLYEWQEYLRRKATFFKILPSSSPTKLTI